MALGKKRHENKNLTVYSVNFKTKDKETHKSVFRVSKKNEAGKFDKVDDVYDLSGTITDIETRVTEWEGKKIESFSVNLRDGDELYMVSFPFAITTRAMLNSLFSLDSFENLEIGTYMSKPKTEGQKSYPQICVRQNGEIIRWKFELKDLPPVEKINFRGQTMSDFTKVDNFFKDQIIELNKRVKASRGEKRAVAQVQAQDDVQTEVETQGGDEDVPFN